MFMAMPISLKIIGENASLDLVFKDTFYAFRSALAEFVDKTCQGIVAISDNEMLASVSFVESGIIG